jgi:predicted acylesterase/phospholipase RssA
MPQQTKPDRLGIGLSGGGLRASFFHIGVLAQMAEQNLLRHVEVISTVSGGSIIGALYYLHAKELLERKADAAITDQDYVEIVRKIESDFLAATEKNIRMATFASFKANFRMMFLNYSSSDRIGELYNEWLYQNVLQGVNNPLEMQELKIQPKAGQENFHPNKHNSDRKAKVPILELNATSLNTGRSWQFSAQTMGEPPTPQSDVVDRKPMRLRRAEEYSDVVPHQQDFPLGHAVAASACVPGLFDPMAVSGLYGDLELKEKIRVQLVDGGVHDNQGIEALMRNNCTCFVISDASGQMGTENNPGTGPLPVLLRASSVLQDRGRTEGLLHLMDSCGINNVAYMNLRTGLPIREIHWIDQRNEQAADHIIPPTTSQDFGVDPRVQENLSKMRTDLDAFTEVEAYSLMLDGYRMSKVNLENFRLNAGCRHIDRTDSVRTTPEETWKFQDIEPWINNPTPDYLRQLEIAHSTFGKALMCCPWLWAVLVIFLGIVGYFIWSQLVELLKSSIPVYVLVGIAVIWLISALVPKLARISRLLNLLRPQAEAIYRSAGFVLGTVFIKFYQIFINRLYVEHGRLNKLIKPEDAGTGHN